MAILSKIYSEILISHVKLDITKGKFYGNWSEKSLEQYNLVR